MIIELLHSLKYLFGFQEGQIVKKFKAPDQMAKVYDLGFF